MNGSIGRSPALGRPQQALASLPQTAPSPYEQFGRTSAAYELFPDDGRVENGIGE